MHVLFFPDEIMADDLFIEGEYSAEVGLSPYVSQPDNNGLTALEVVFQAEGLYGLAQSMDGKAKSRSDFNSNTLSGHNRDGMGW